VESEFKRRSLEIKGLPAKIPGPGKCGKDSVTELVLAFGRVFANVSS
jgi:hypothetical protein